MSMSSKTTHLVWKCFLFSNSLLGFLDLGPTTDRQVLKSTYLHMSLPKIINYVEPKSKKFALMSSNCVETFRC